MVSFHRKPAKFPETSPRNSHPIPAHRVTALVSRGRLQYITTLEADFVINLLMKWHILWHFMGWLGWRSATTSYFGEQKGKRVSHRFYRYSTCPGGASRCLWPTGQVTPKFNKCRLKYRYPILYNVGYLNISRWFSGDRTLHQKNNQYFLKMSSCFCCRTCPFLTTMYCQWWKQEPWIPLIVDVAGSCFINLSPGLLQPIFGPWFPKGRKWLIVLFIFII